MTEERPRPSSWVWLLPVVAGSFFRFWFGDRNALWNCAPDQLAWDMGLDDALSSGDFSYKQFIHYPHEGGSLLLSLLTILFRPLAGIMPALSWAALVADALSRYVQIRVALRLFGTRTAAWFAAWTVLAVPLLLPWGTVDVGLHALVAFAPFLLVRYASYPSPSSLKIGLICGVSVALAYDCLVLIPAFAIWSLMQDRDIRTSLRQLAWFALGCAIAIAPHLFLRVFLDNGFHLEDLSATSIRGLDWGTSVEGSLAGHVFTTWHSILPASFLLSAVDRISPRALCNIVLAFVLVGTIAALVPRRDRSPAAVLMAVVILCFTLAYAIGPLFTDRIDVRSFMHYRHFSFIVPIVVLLMIHGFSRISRVDRHISATWILCCAIASIFYVSDVTPCTKPNYRAAGWVLARKFGDEPSGLIRIRKAAPLEYRDEVTIGYGWGLTATLLENRSTRDTAVVDKLEQLLSQFSDQDKPLLEEGVRFAFGPGITPVLDKDLFKMIDEGYHRLDQSGSTP